MSIRVARLSYAYRNRAEQALTDISAEFKPGEVTLIAGASGCGKTTLIRCINGLIPQSYTAGRLSGEVTLFGRNNAVMQLAEISQVVGAVLQDPERQIVATEVMNEIAFGLENLGLPRDEIRARIIKTAELLHIEPLLARQTFLLSGGEKQKVALAGVLAMRPRAILLDEPLASLDTASGHEALLLMRELADSGIAIVIIEHRVEDVLEIRPEHCVYMNAGRIVYDGDVPGLMQAVDWREIKLPAPVVIRKIRSRHDQHVEPPVFARTNSAAPPLIEFRGVGFRYEDGPEILHDVSFAVRPGDIMAVIGPNGAGKTTLMKHAIGLNRPSRGLVLIDQQDSRQMSVAQIARTVGYVFQSPSHMLFAPTVREELSFGPHNIGMDKETISANLSRALDAVNLPDSAELAPLAMSFGQQKRISIASILTMSPRVLVMDEPTAGQDYANYTHFMDDIVSRIRADTETGAGYFKALIFITHDLDLAIAYANRIVMVVEGQIAADGAPHEVLRDESLLARSRVRSTSLLKANLGMLDRCQRFMSAARLAGLATLQDGPA
ncbi:MAG: energy-coupling factor ABC transporter ATP-binding protein [Chloroflexi bacterium]|nr:energy-coupling factor ABC transporter ATP-binding protein [Chloroflexota bacterium]MCL5273714.1 energy-coupling factor ABC transporter ATP-binding protein [Chloroflexota bacterium]